MRIEWLPEALKDLERLYDFIGRYSESAARNAITKILSKVGELLQFPERGRPSEVDTNGRELIIQYGARGYVVRYRVANDRVVIIRVWQTLEQR